MHLPETMLILRYLLLLWSQFQIDLLEGGGLLRESTPILAPRPDLGSHDEADLESTCCGLRRYDQRLTVALPCNGRKHP
jgi:hypothetical protein